MADRNNDPPFPAISEFLRSMIGDERLVEWDPDATLAFNVYRLISGPFTSNSNTQHPSSSTTQIRDDQESLLRLHRLQERMIRQAFPLDPHGFEAKAAVQRAITTLSCIHSNTTPLEALRIRIRALFISGPSVASFIVENLHATVRNRSIELSPKTWDLSKLPRDSFFLQWSSSKLAASLVLITASTKRTMFDALRSQSDRLGGVPTLTKIGNTPTASFSEAFAEAKIAAEKQDRTTVIGVSFADVHILRLEKTNTAERWTSFSHSFVVGVGPAGFIVWQAWGDHGYCLDEYIDRGGARIRSWEEARQFVLDFERLATATGGWNSKKNKWYRRCFEVDINKVCWPNGPRKPIVPKYDAWVRLHVINDVKLEDINKFNWE